MPTTFEALFIVLLAIAPGWVAVQTWDRGTTWAKPAGQLGELLHALTFSTIIQLLVSPFTIWWLYPYWGRISQEPVRLAVWLALVVLVVPLFGGALVSKASDALYQGRLKGQLRWPERWLRWLWPTAYPSAWDAFFADNIPDGRFLTITFKDGSRVCGPYAGSATFAKTSPQERGLYLESEWLLDDAGYPFEVLPGSAGILIHDFLNIQHIRIQEPS